METQDSLNLMKLGRQRDCHFSSLLIEEIMMNWIWARVTWPPFISISIRERLLASLIPGFLRSSQQQILISLHGCLKGIIGNGGDQLRADGRTRLSGYQTTNTALGGFHGHFPLDVWCPAGSGITRTTHSQQDKSLRFFKRSPVEELINVAGSNSNGKLKIYLNT